MTTDQQPQTRPYADHVADYALAGWPCILPVPPREKHPPPVGFTGAEGRDTSTSDLVTWAGSHAAQSIALRMPEGVIGIDVDQYTKSGKQKHGAETLMTLEQRWGPLPATWSSTARGSELGPGASRIMLFRVPPRRYTTKLSATRPDGTLTGDIEIIQRHHRYAVVWPSPHPDANDGAGGVYRWYEPSGRAAELPPRPEQLAELPPAWIEALAEGATTQSAASAPVGDGQRLLDQLLDDHRPECAEITSARLIGIEEITRADAGSRHDVMTGRVHQLVQLAAGGHTGVGGAAMMLREAWSQITAGEERGEEFERMLLTSARKAATVVGTVQVPRDPCINADSFSVPSAAPGVLDEDGHQVEGVDEPRWFYPRQIIGTHAFDPAADLDQPLAQAVLERTYPLIRYAYDSNGWLLRVPDRWELFNDVSNRAASLVAGLMPIGDPTAEKGSDEHARSKRRARFNTNAGRTAIAKTAKALVEGGMHPCAVRLADLDADAEVLWAGGVPWNLRACHAGAPLETWVARIDPATPHLQTAAVLPALVPTPTWDAFLAAVWPDEALRRWAIRVLAVTLTGRSDRSLPILLGEQGRGKTAIISLLMSVLGSYAHAADRRLLNAEGARAHQSIVYALKGRRLSFIDEGTKGGQFAEAQLKLLTGGGELTGNQMNQNPISFRPTHTLVLTTNPEDEPVLTDPAIRARVRLIPCTGEEDQVRETRAAIGAVNGPVWRREAPGVLAKMMIEAAAWLADPRSGSTVAAPEGVQQLAEALAHQQDPIKLWLEDEAEPWPSGTPSRELYQAFVGSCTQANMRRDSIPSHTAWGRALTREGFPSVHTRQGNRRALRIRPQEPWAATREELAPLGEGFAPRGEGLVKGYEANPSQTFSQVNQSFPNLGEGCEGFSSGSTHIHAHTSRAHGAVTQEGVKPFTPFTEAAPEEAPKPRRQQSEAAKAKAVAAREEKRLAAIAAAGGPVLELPALLLRDGTVRSITAADADGVLATITDELTIDVETTGYSPGHQHYGLRTVQLGNEHFTVVLDPADHAQTIRDHVVRVPVLHAHSATADLIPLELAGLLEHGIEEAWSRMHDTVILAKLVDPRSVKSAEGLKQLAPAVLGAAAVSPAAEEARSALFKAGKWLTETKPTTEVERSGWAQVDSRSETMIRYAGSDVLDDAAIARRLPYPEPNVWRREVLAQTMTARVAHTGLRLDAEHVIALRTEQQAALVDATQRLAAFGVENAGSDAQVAAVVEAHGLVLPRTAGGRPSVAKGALNAYAELEGPLGDLVRARLDYQKAENRLGLFLDGWHNAVTHGDGRVRPTVYTLEAKTGRMSCVRPNLQQVPRAGGFRACITADPGFVLISADFAQVELRVAAALSQDQALIAILEDPERDIHREIAQIVWGPGAGKAERYQAKRKVFGRIYGSGINGLVTADPPVSEAIAKSIVAAMDYMTPGLTEWSRMVANAVEAGNSRYVSHSGRVIHMPKDRGYAAPNYCIQGEARELLIDSFERWSQTRWGRCPILPVHDEIVAMVPEDDADEATAALEACMASELAGVRILAEASEPSTYWRDSE